ncbi:MAG: RsmB/NOP family class I SAM-dependent RNA methyltransferase [Rhodobacteraceae bacterium]|nr:RsmB/NOP family class I SAM-dependent RNA methyltransferase [Paracoccaceae bacterium]
MTPAARVAAAAGILDSVQAGNRAEAALSAWGRASRFAGSSDRAAVRDLVFEALRRRRSLAWLAGAGDGPASGRDLMIGACVAAGQDPDTVFTGQGHAPAPLSPAERARLAAAPPLARAPEGVALDCPDWLVEPLRAALGAAFAPVMAILQARAPLWLRVNTARADQGSVLQALAEEGILAEPHPAVPTALRVTQGAPRVQRSAAFAAGLVEVQDLGSQIVSAQAPVTPGLRVLDYCAGGGGKALALAARGAAVTAHDAAPRRMAGLPARAARAGLAIDCLPGPVPAGAPAFGLVLLDVPCSGSGTWRRNPELKWALDRAGLERLTAVQDGILAAAAQHVAPGGMIQYVTCSLLEAENGARVAAFLAANPGFALSAERRVSPSEGGDGFYSALLVRAPAEPAPAGIRP